MIAESFSSSSAMLVFDIFQSLPAGLCWPCPLVRHCQLNPEEKTCSVLVYWRTSLHIKEYQSFYMQTSELIELPRSQSPNQGLEIVDASADSVLLIHFEPARPFIPSNWRHFHFHGRLRKNLPNIPWGGGFGKWNKFSKAPN